MWTCLGAFVLTVVQYMARGAALIPPDRGGSRKERPMGRTVRRFRLIRSSMLETIWAIGASYAAGALPTQVDTPAGDRQIALRKF